IYAEGACKNANHDDAASGGGAWISPTHAANRTIKVRGPTQTAAAGALSAIICALQSVADYTPVTIITTSRQAINGLTADLPQWEDRNWLGVQENKLYERAAYELRRRSAQTGFQWANPARPAPGSHHAATLARQGAALAQPTHINLSVPAPFRLTGAKLASLNQASAYRNIRRRKESAMTPRPATAARLHDIRTAVRAYTGDAPTNASIWSAQSHPHIRRNIRQFLFRATHRSQPIGEYWNSYHDERMERRFCQLCGETESLDHILLNCPNSIERVTIWHHAKQLWPHGSDAWPELSLGTILGCGQLTATHHPRPPPHPPDEPPPGEPPPGPPVRHKGATRLLRILISEAAYLIWILRCARVIEGRTLSAPAITTRWERTMNDRIKTDRLIAIKSKRTQKALATVHATWTATLDDTNPIPDHWAERPEVLVGIKPPGPPT
ncbi:ribonuclease H-like protein, partial [Auriscalpium vulgare]